MCTIIIIVLQDINFVRIKLNERTKREINNVSMHRFKLEDDQNEVDAVFDREKILKRIDSTDLNEKEDVCFDRKQFLDNKDVHENLYNEPDPVYKDTTHIQIRMPERKSFIMEAIDNNQTFLIRCFIITLLIVFLSSNIELFLTVTFTSIAIFTPLNYPIIVSAYFISEWYLKK
jgi:hypothetical protein